MNSPEGNVYLDFIPLKLLGVILFLGLLAFAFLDKVGLRFPTSRLSKKYLVEHYKINKRTLNNWIDCFLPTDLQNQFHHRKNIPVDSLFKAMLIFGSPKDFPVLNRKIIIQLGEGNYRQLRRTVNHHGKLDNLPLDQLKSIRTFPPSFGEKVALGFGVHPSEIESLKDQ